MKLPHIIVLCIFLCGCSFLQEEPRIAAQAQQIDKHQKISEKELKAYLNGFELFFRRAIEEASLKLANNPQFELDRGKITEWKLRSVSSLQNILYQGNLVVAFVEMTIYCIQLRNFFEDNPNYFAQGQSIVVEATKALEEKAVVIGNKLTNNFAPAHEEMKLFAKKHPLTELFVSENITSQLGYNIENWRDYKALNAVYTLVRIPLAPILTADSFNKISEEFTTFNKNNIRLFKSIDQMPNEVRWQTELLLSNLNNNQQLNTVVEGFGKISKSSEELVNVAKKFDDMPQEIRQEFIILLEEFVERHHKLQTSLGSVEKTTQSFAIAGENWEKTLHVLGETVESFQSDTPDEHKDTKPFDINEYTANFAQLGETAEKLEAAIVNLQQLLTKKEIPENIEKINSSVLGNAKDVIVHTRSEATKTIDYVGKETKKTVDYTNTQAKELVDYIYRRLLTLCVIVFILSIIFIVVKSFTKKLN